MQWMVIASALLLGMTTLPTNGSAYTMIVHVLIFGKRYSSVYFPHILAAF